ncbi:aminoglycoside phosphotransferase family protein [Streptomyces sp. NPDC002928]|uniref:phosphotransferase family protein n=1 Tax=Streptomyces sp. NPDC002928 TaxID=3154440 RepID=UPI0033A1BC0D
MLHHLPHRTRTALVRFFAEARRRRAGGEVVVGHHNSNHILPLGQPLAYLLGMGSGQVRAKFRVPFETIEVVPRIWRESEVLRAVSDRLGDVPRCLADFGEWSLHAYVPGHSLAEEASGKPVGEERMAALADFFARLAGMPPDDFPQLPDDWPRGDDSRGFLHRLARFTEQRVHQDNRPRFGRLFDCVGVPADAVSRFLRTVPDPARRPFVLLHTDVHRANVVVTPTSDGERLTVLDWELSLYGDPLHDLATHLVRMDYDESERKLMTELWAEAMRRSGRADLTVGLDPDLDTYLGYEYVQSVFPDVMRAALALPAEPLPEDVERAADRVRRALCRAWEPLRMPGEPESRPALVRALRLWHADDGARRSATAKPTGRRVSRPGTGRVESCPDADRPRGIDWTSGLRRDPDPQPGPDRETSIGVAESL